MDNNIVSKIWAGMSTTNIHLGPPTPIQNSKSLAKTRTLNAVRDRSLFLPEEGGR